MRGRLAVQQPVPHRPFLDFHGEEHHAGQRDGQHQFADGERRNTLVGAEEAWSELVKEIDRFMPLLTDLARTLD